MRTQSVYANALQVFRSQRDASTDPDERRELDDCLRAVAQSIINDHGLHTLRGFNSPTNAKAVPYDISGL